MPPFPKKEFTARLLDWFAQAKRPLPWRESYDPYSVWISEIMLQQTQMERGVAYFKRWMTAFPDTAAVARASEEDILAAWEGLGYYSRARNLHAAAKRIMDHHGGVFPRDHEAIRALPGVGEYTAGAIASIAFNSPFPAVDANVLRIFSRLLDIDQPIGGKQPKEAITTVVQSLLPLAEPRLVNQALMEFGALVCGKSPGCAACPMEDMCLAKARGTVADRPAGKSKKEYTLWETVAGIVIREGSVLVRKRPPGGLWPGLWEFPGGGTLPGESPEQAVARILRADFGTPVAVERKIGVVRHGYTTNRVTMHGYMCNAAADGTGARVPEGVWVPNGELSGYAFASGHRKLLEKLGWK